MDQGHSGPSGGERDQAQIPAQPSQAEGDRGTVEESLREHGQDGGGASRAQPGDATAGNQAQGDIDDPQRQPSQAEGDRATVEESLREKEARG